MLESLLRGIRAGGKKNKSASKICRAEKNKERKGGGALDSDFPAKPGGGCTVFQKGRVCLTREKVETRKLDSA